MLPRKRLDTTNEGELFSDAFFPDIFDWHILREGISSAMEKMAHYAYFNWDKIPVNGMSGVCWRLCFTEIWDYSCTDALVTFDYASPLFQSLGYSFRMAVAFF